MRVFKDRYEALAYWRAALRKEDEELQLLIRQRMKKIQLLRNRVLWNEQELKKEILGRARAVDPRFSKTSSDFALTTSFSREPSPAAEGSLGLKKSRGGLMRE